MRFLDEFGYNSCWAQEVHVHALTPFSYTECMGGDFDRN